MRERGALAHIHRHEPIMMRLVHIALALALAVPLADLVSRALRPRPPPPSAALPHVNAYATNPFVQTGRPFLFWHAPGIQYLQSNVNALVRYQINSRGFRGPEVGALPPPGSQRLLVVGDSVVEGAGVEFDQGFTALLDHALRPRQWEVVNGATLGASPVYHALNLPRYEALHPTALVLILSENDLSEDRVREATYGSLAPMGDPRRLVAGLTPADARAWGATWRDLARRGAVALRYYLRPNATESRLRHQVAVWRQAGYSFTLGTQADFDDPVVRTAAWALTEPYLEDVYAACRRAGIGLAVATLNLQPLVPARAGLLPQAEFLDATVAAWAQARGLPFRALAGALPPDAGDAGRLVAWDAHLTPDGHQRIADALATWLATTPLLQSAAPPAPVAQPSSREPPNHGT